MNQPSFSRFHHRRPRILFVVLNVFLAVVATQFGLKTPSALVSASRNHLDLSGVWEECLPLAEIGGHEGFLPSTNNCDWRERMIPGSVPAGELTAQKGWVIYRKHVDTPAFCAASDSICRMVIGEVGDALLLSVNGKAVGQHGGLPPYDRYARHYPVALDVPSSLLRPAGGGHNEFVLHVRHLKKAQSGVLRGPLALVSPDDAIPVVQTLISQNVLIPFVSALGILLISLLSFLSIRFNRIDDEKLTAFTRYGLVSGIFLVSYSSIPREYISLPLAGCLHFILRFSMDWAYFELLVKVTGWLPEIRKPTRFAYLVLICLFIAVYMADPWVGGSFNRFTGFNGAVKLSGWFDFALVFGPCIVDIPRIRRSRSPRSRTVYSNTAWSLGSLRPCLRGILTMRRGVSTIYFGPYLYGAVGSFLTRSRQRKAVVCLAFLLAILTFCGTLTFHGVSGLPHFIIFSPFFAILILGIDLWGDHLFTHENLRTTSELGKLASQVAHDIRSPLAALEMISDDLSGVPEESRVVLRGAVGRIKDIANGLLSAHKSVHQGWSVSISEEREEMSSQHLPALIDGLLSEKRIQYRQRPEIEIDFASGPEVYGLFSSLPPVEFKRVLSNLVNNAAEAIDGPGRVWVSLEASGGEASIVVRDNGKGIPPAILAQLGQRGATHGKSGGAGLGLYHARKSVERWGGRLLMTSDPGVGTSVSIVLPCSSPPGWFASKLEFAGHSVVMVLDDDPSVHNIWRKRFDGAAFRAAGVTVLHFSSCREVREWISTGGVRREALVCLFDFELRGENATGLDLLEELGLSRNAALVTSRYEEKSIRDDCTRLGVSLIPKGLAGFVPMAVSDVSDSRSNRADSENGQFTRGSEVISSSERPPMDAILIDDDELVHLSWRYAAKRVGRTLVGFKDADSFFSASGQLDRCVPLYIDSCLGKGTDGRDVLGQEIARRVSEMGFQEIYLATGLAPESLGPLPWIKGVRGKDPPWSDA